MSAHGPILISETTTAPANSMAANPKDIKARCEQLQADRGNWNSHWEEIKNVFCPEHPSFTGETTDGTKVRQQIFKSSPQNYLELGAAGLNSLMTPAAQEWSKPRFIRDELNQSDAGKEWLSQVAKVMRSERYAPGTGFGQAMDAAYREVLAFGNVSVFVGERNNGRLLYQARPLSETYFAENDEGIVDTMYRKPRFTARQVMQKFPKTASEKVRKFIKDNKPDTQIDIIHAVQPRTDRDYGKRGQADMPFLSCYIECSPDHILEEGGFPEWPFPTWRWRRNPGATYAISQGMIALPEAKGLPQAEKNYLQYLQRRAAPAWWIPDDGSAGPVRLEPNGINFFKGERQPMAMIAPGNASENMEWMQGKEREIGTVLYANILQTQDTQTEMTYGEAEIRRQERWRLLGPVSESGTDFHAQIFSREFPILVRQGKIPEAPPELQGQELTIEFTSPIATAQRIGQAQILGQVLQLVAPLIAMDKTGQITDEVLSRIEASKVIPSIGDDMGLDPALIVDDDVYMENQQRKQMAMMAQNAIPMGADAAAKGAGAVDDLASAQEKGADIAGLMERMGMQQQAA